MDSTVTSTCGTTLLRGALLRPLTGGSVRLVAQGAQAVAPVAQPRRWQATLIAPVFGPFQGAAIAESGTAAVTDHMVTDHKYSTRLGSSSCSPPV